MNIRNAFAPRANKPSTQKPESTTHALYYEVAERVDLVSHARAAGHANLPHESATAPNDVETAIETEFRNRHSASLEAVRGDLRSIAEEFAKLEDAMPTVRDLKVVPRNAAATLERTLAGDQSIGHTRRELQERHRDERGFRRQHDLGREARYPESRVMHMALVAVLVLVESVLNLGFFAAASPIGLFGGFLVAVGVSLVNAASGVVAGFVPFRHLRNPRLALRVVAIVATIAYAVSTVMFNESLFAAPLRQALADLPVQETAATTPLLEAVQQISSQPEFAASTCRRRLVLVTNGEQNSDIMSAYTHMVQFTSFKKSAAFKRVRADLHGVEVELLYAPRGRWARTLDSSLQDFWRSYMLACGSASVRVRRL